MGLAETQGRRPNLLFVFADQLRADAVGCAGNPDVRTPQLDALAAQGMYFTHAVANCPVCTPSRGTILTGRYPLAHGATSNDLPLGASERTFGHLLGEAGWRTGYIGKWHLDGIPRDRFTPPGPRRRGFEFWAAWNCSHAYFRGRYFADAPEAVAIDGYEPDGQTDLALRFIRERRAEPWALFLSFGPPHNPYPQVPDAYKEMYDPERLTLRGNVVNADRRTVADYYAAITALDDNLGRLLRLLDELDLAQDTIVVYTSDHGDMLFSHGMKEKQKPFEESIRVPLAVRYPRAVPAGRRSDALISTVDLLPTLLGLVEVPVPPNVQGTDLSAHLRGRPCTLPESAFLLNPIPVDNPADVGQGEWRGVRTARHTYAAGLAGPWVLYDDVEDPLQQHNLVSDPEHADVRERLQATLADWLQRTGDGFLPWPDHVRTCGLTELWNERERAMHPKEPRLVDA